MQTIGSFGRLLRIVTYSTPGTFTWTKQPDVGLVSVHVIGGGGGGKNGTTNGTSGGSSSFGSHCSANGGGGGTTSPGSGGTASGGDINISGESGQPLTYDSFAQGGFSYFARFGRGGRSVSDSSYYDVNTGSTIPAVNRGAGGGGGSSQKIIKVDVLGSTESVVVGASGTGSVGTAGVVIIYEYSK